MTGPTSTTKSNDRTRDAKDDSGSAEAPRPAEADRQPAVSDGDVADLARTQQDVAQRARQLVAADLVTSESNGGGDEQRGEMLLTAAREDLLAELRAQEQEQARKQLVQASRSSEDAAAGLVQGITTIVRSIVPAALVRPEDVIEATFALADQGLRVGRRLALSVADSVKSVSTAV
jgi:hypothetical protein